MSESTTTPTAETTYTYRCDHPADKAPPIGTRWGSACPACLHSEIQAAKSGPDTRRSRSIR